MQKQRKIQSRDNQQTSNMLPKEPEPKLMEQIRVGIPKEPKTFKENFATFTGNRHCLKLFKCKHTKYLEKKAKQSPEDLAKAIVEASIKHRELITLRKGNQNLNEYLIATLERHHLIKQLTTNTLQTKVKILVQQVIISAGLPAEHKNPANCPCLNSPLTITQASSTYKLVKTTTTHFKLLSQEYKTNHQISILSLFKDYYNYINTETTIDLPDWVTVKAIYTEMAVNPHPRAKPAEDSTKPATSELVHPIYNHHQQW